MVEELINTLILIEALKFKIIPCYKNYYSCYGYLFSFLKYWSEMHIVKYNRIAKNGNSFLVSGEEKMEKVVKEVDEDRWPTEAKSLHASV